MELHKLKICKEYAEAKMNGIKNFEIRKNDRNYKVGDFIKYKPIKINNGIIPYEDEIRSGEIADYFNTHIFQITYICDYMQRDNYIVFSERPISI